MQIVASFSAGAFGSAVGALTSIVLCALVALSGIAANLAGAQLNLVNEVTFGLLLGPHVSFAPACCALCYAWKKGYIADSKDSVTPLISLNHADVLLVGGVFGVAGWYLNSLLNLIAGSAIDTVAMSIVILSLVSKQIFGGSMIGRLPAGQKRFGKNSSVWLSWQTAGRNYNMLTLSIVVSLLSGGLTMYFHEIAVQTGNTTIFEISKLFMWSLGLITLMFLGDRLNVPIFHHIGLCAAVGAQMVLKLGANEYIVMLWSLALGIMAAYSGDLLGQLFHANGPGIVDPPSAAIAFTAPFGLSIFPALGIDRQGSVLNILVPIVLIAGAAVYECSMHRTLQNCENS